MKLLSSLAFGLLITLVPAVSLHAQNDSSGGSGAANGLAAGGGDGGGHGRRLSFLSQEDRQHYMRVRKQVMEANPDLKSEQESLMKQMQSMHDATDATPQDRQAFRQKFMAHHKKVDAAMIAADPTVAPIVEQVNQHLKARFEQHAGGGAGGGNGGGAPEPGT